MPIENTQGSADAEAMRRFREKADEYYQNLEETYYGLLPGNHTPADAVLLAHLMTAVDGFNNVTLVTDWSRRPRSGWGTVLAYVPELESGLIARFVLECRHDEHARQLAILVDDYRPGERLPTKMQHEHKLASLGFRVLQVSELEILSDPAAICERVEDVLSAMSYEVLEDAGKRY